MKASYLKPLLPLRDIVIFPSMVVPLFVGREKSIKALQEVMKTDKSIVLVSQKNSEIDDPTSKDLYQYGCLSKVLQLLKLPDGTVKVLVEGEKRIKILKYSENDNNYLTCEVEIVEDQNVLASGRAEVVARQLPIVFVEREFFGTTVSIFFQDGRFYSTEVTANWRLQLWQDVIEDVVSKDRLFIGYGYSEIIPAMTDPLNNGNDSTNENLHNYFVQVFARGGLLQLIIVILIIFTYISIWVKQKNNYKILQFVIPIIVVSVFDPTLETVRFPLIYYSFLGYFLSDKKVYS